MPTRRTLMTGAGALTATALLGWPRTSSAATQLEAAVQDMTGSAGVTRGRVTLQIPQIAENGFSVFTTVSVDSPMTSENHVKAIHLFSEKNPIAHIASFRIGPRAGRAKISTNIRLAASQRIAAIAEMSDGSYWSDEKSVVVTVAACIDGG